MKSLNSYNLKLIAVIFETILSIPIIGGLIIIGFAWTPLTIMFVIHLTGIILAVTEGKKFFGYGFGLAGAVLGWIPILGWFLHVIASTILTIELIKDKKKLEEEKERALKAEQERIKYAQENVKPKNIADEEAIQEASFVEIKDDEYQIMKK